MTSSRSWAGTAATVAPGAFVLLWSTGFIGAKYGLPYAEPFWFLGLRLAVAAGLLLLIAAVARAPRPRGRAAYGRSAISGVLLHSAYLGGVFWAVDHGFPSGVAAVVVSVQPVLVAVLGRRVLGESLRLTQWAGLLLGFAGVTLVLAPGLGDRELGLVPLGSCLIALAGGTLGTLHQKRYGDGIPLLWGTAMQYAAASGLLLVVGLLTESPRIEWTLQFSLAFAWLVLALSLGAILLLLWLLRRGTAATVSSLFYLVPPVTVLMAYFAFDEALTWISIAGIVVTSLGVALVVRTRAAADPPGRERDPAST